MPRRMELPGPKRTALDVRIQRRDDTGIQLGFGPVAAIAAYTSPHTKGLIPAALFDDWFDPGAPGEGDDAVGKFCEFASGVMTCP